LLPDFGEDFTVYDTNGETPLSAMISSITKENPAAVTTLDEVRHGLETGDFVTFTEVKGMTELNGCEPMEIKVTGPYTFTIGDTTKMSDYKSGGYVKQVKMQQKLTFKSLVDSLAEPEYTISDFAKMDRQDQLLVGFQAVDAFLDQTGALPMPGNAEHANKVLALARDINSKSKNPIGELDEKLIKQMSSNARGDLSPMVNP